MLNLNLSQKINFLKYKPKNTDPNHTGINNTISSQDKRAGDTVRRRMSPELWLIPSDVFFLWSIRQGSDGFCQNPTETGRIQSVWRTGFAGMVVGSPVQGWLTGGCVPPAMARH